MRINVSLANGYRAVTPYTHSIYETYEIYLEWLKKNVPDGYEFGEFGTVTGIPYVVRLDREDALMFKLNFGI
jgi:hypothetical protein